MWRPIPIWVGLRILSCRRETLGRQICAAAPCLKFEIPPTTGLGGPSARVRRPGTSWSIEGAVPTDDFPSSFVERLLSNVPDSLFKPMVAPTHSGIVDWLETARLNDFECQNGRVVLFGSGKEQWTASKARAFVRALQELWGWQPNPVEPPVIHRLVGHQNP